MAELPALKRLKRCVYMDSVNGDSRYHLEPSHRGACQGLAYCLDLGSAPGHRILLAEMPRRWNDKNTTIPCPPSDWNVADGLLSESLHLRERRTPGIQR
jgi:hypothetical protein